MPSTSIWPPCMKWVFPRRLGCHRCGCAGKKNQMEPTRSGWCLYRLQRGQPSCVLSRKGTPSQIFAYSLRTFRASSFKSSRQQQRSYFSCRQPGGSSLWLSRLATAQPSIRSPRMWQRCRSHKAHETDSRQCQPLRPLICRERRAGKRKHHPRAI